VVKRTRDSVDDLFTIQAKLSSGKQIDYTREDALNRLVEGGLGFSLLNHFLLWQRSLIIILSY